MYPLYRVVYVQPVLTLGCTSRASEAKHPIAFSEIFDLHFSLIPSSIFHIRRFLQHLGQIILHDNDTKLFKQCLFTNDMHLHVMGLIDPYVNNSSKSNTDLANVLTFVVIEFICARQLWQWLPC